MRRLVVSVRDMQSALQDLALTASTFTRGGGRSIARQNLTRSINHASELLSAEVAAGVQPETADQLVSAWLQTGGDWQELVAAVNRAGRAGIPHRKENRDG
jgi:hypothetical protein